MYNIQEQEEMDYYPQSEAQNCFSEAQMDMAASNNKVSQEIDSLIKNGFHVLVCYHPWFCKATDAFVGLGFYVANKSLNRQKLNEQMNDLTNEDGEYDSDVTYKLLPLKK